MSEEKQIEELAKFCCFPCEMHYDFGCVEGVNPRECYISIETAKRLYAAGYRKQREQRRWQFEDRGGKKTKRPVCSGCGASPAYYLHKSKAAPPYCHECGAPMSEEVAE